MNNYFEKMQSHGDLGNSLNRIHTDTILHLNAIYRINIYLGFDFRVTFGQRLVFCLSFLIKYVCRV